MAKSFRTRWSNSGLNYILYLIASLLCVGSSGPTLGYGTKNLNQDYPEMLGLGTFMRDADKSLNNLSDALTWVHRVKKEYTRDSIVSVIKNNINNGPCSNSCKIVWTTIIENFEPDTPTPPQISTGTPSPTEHADESVAESTDINTDPANNLTGVGSTAGANGTATVVDNILTTTPGCQMVCESGGSPCWCE